MREHLRNGPAVVLVATLAAVLPLTVSAQAPGSAIGIHAGSENWKPAPPTMPAGVEMAILEGDPRQPGLFSLRIRAPAGTQLAPHTHPAPERVTVISGSVGVGFGTVFDAAAVSVYRAGDYYVNPPGVAHYVSFPGPAVLQVTGEGPWVLEYLKP